MIEVQPLDHTTESPMESPGRLPGSQFETSEFYLQPGEWRIESAPCLMKTLLGSCVGITFWDRETGVGAMCHAMLPASPASGKITGAGGRYVDLAIGAISRSLDRLGVARRDAEVKVFGGADVLSLGKRGETIGDLNTSSARKMLARAGYRITAESLGGDRGVVIEFNTSTGEVLLRRLARAC